MSKRKFALLLAAYSLVSCTGKRVKENPLPTDSQLAQGASSVSAGKVAGNLPANSLAMLIIAKIKASIKAKSDLSEAQIDQIGTSAEKKIVASKPAGALNIKEVEAGNVNEFMDDLAEGALETLGQPEFMEMSQDKVLKLLTIIIESTIQGLKDGNAAALDENTKNTMLTDIMKKIVGALDEAGFDQTEIAAAAEVSLETAVANLDKAGILTETNASALLAALIKGAVLGTQKPASLNIFKLADGSEKKDEEAEVDEDTGEGVDSGEETPEDEDKDSDGDGVPDDEESDESDNPDEVEVGELPPDEAYAELDGFDPDGPMDGTESPEQVNAAMYFSILAGAVGSLNEAGFDTKEVLTLIPILIRSLVESLGAAGVDKKGIEQYITYAVQGSVEGLAATGVTKAAELSSAMGSIAKGVLEAVSTLGFTSDQYGRILGMVVRSTVSQLDDLKLIQKADMPQAASVILANSTQALKSLGVTKENMTQLLPLIATIIGAGIADLDAIGLGDDDAVAFVTKATGAVFGSLDTLGFSADELADLGTDFADDLKAELVKIDKDLYGDIDYDNLDYDSETDTDDEV